jgi:hypothetical protein
MSERSAIEIERRRAGLKDLAQFLAWLQSRYPRATHAEIELAQDAWAAGRQAEREEAKQPIADARATPSGWVDLDVIDE